MSTTITTRAYRDGALVKEGFTLAEVSDYLTQDNVITWVDFLTPNQDDLVELAEELGLHKLAVEDALEDHQRPKIDFYASHVFLSCHALRLDATAGVLIEAEINCFVSKKWIVTVRKNASFEIEPVIARWDRSADLLKLGTGFMLYAVLDLVVDEYFECLNSFDSYYDDVSTELFSDHPIAIGHEQHWFDMRRVLVRFHRLVVPLREAIGGLMRREHGAIDAELYPYFQDLYDHVLRVTESSDALRDLVATIVETNLALRDFRQNQIVKQVTGWAAVIAVPTLITGFYGMNVPFPGEGEPWGVITAVVFLLSGSYGLFTIFRRRDWL
jgi:magnesium transporter